ncbi:hypothetical protein D7X88_06565 [bacterium C-53]|nr:hypothetical protein [Lachnospiraceae bacterium]NBI02882.1 hypothetical protein [Lachnospiraceae bacterium]RKJ11006.1 hypothetical protein D7X88_06565 [bacterium C-53]
MAQKNSYILILLDSLRKKDEILRKLLQKTQEQTVILTEKEIDADAFEKSISEKDMLISQLTKLDEGFESVYARVRAELDESRADYAEEIREMQSLISSVTDKSVSIRAIEERNYKRAQEYFRVTRGKIHHARLTSRVADSYHTSMVGIPGARRTQIDQKK